MVRLAFLYPGQGSQVVGMGCDLYDTFDDARSYYDSAENILKFPLKQYSFDGPDETLKQTYVTQPALFVHSVILTKLLADKGITPAITAGHSLGEYSALAAAGTLPFEDLLNLVRIRGELMQSAGEKYPGAMTAFIGLENEAVEEICNEASDSGVVEPANFNAPGQIVISGSIEGVRKASEIARERGVRKTVELNVGCAFHSPLMKGATEGLVEQIEKTEMKSTRIPVVSNVDAMPMDQPGEIKKNLELQLTSPVRWSESVEFIAHQDIDAFVEVGAGNVLRGLSKRIQKEIPCHSVGNVEDLSTIAEKLA